MKVAMLLALGILAFSLGFVANEFGLLNLKNLTTQASRAGDFDTITASESSTLLGEGAAPTPTPLPPHFPQPEQDDLGAPIHKSDATSFGEAYSACWREGANVPESSTDHMTLDDLTEFFGPLKKRENLNQTANGAKVGVIFDKGIFKTGAAGTAIEEAGHVVAFQIRAEGKIMECQALQNCRCL